jgi:RNA polymerase sigma-70 factor (ECF subfamily)
MSHLMRPDESGNDPLFFEALRRRDAIAFRRLVELYGARILALASQFARDRDEADDLTQDIFLEIYRSLPKFRGESTLYTWLFRIALNQGSKARARTRARDARLPVRPSAEEKEPFDGTPDEGPTPDIQAERTETQRLAEAALAGLDPSHRAALYLRAVEGLSYSEIAKILDCPTGTVKSRIFFARLRVSEALGLAAPAEDESDAERIDDAPDAKKGRRNEDEDRP